MSKHKSKPVSIQTAKSDLGIAVRRAADLAAELEETFCASCKHWDSEFCRRYPPTVFRTPGGHPIAHWPPVAHDDGCGEWEH